MNWKHWVALLLQSLGFEPTYSHNVADGLTCGYGKLDDNGFWEYPVFNHKEVQSSSRKVKAK